MAREVRLGLFCDEFVKLVNSGYDTRFFYLTEQAKRNLRKDGQKFKMIFKDENIILELRSRRVKVVGKRGSILCDGKVEGKRPNSGVGTKVHPCK